MYAVIRIGKAKPGKVGEVVQRIDEGFVPIVSQIPGVVSYYLVELEDDQVATIPILENSEAAERLNQEALAWIRENVVDLMAAPPVEYVGEVKRYIGK